MANRTIFSYSTMAEGRVGKQRAIPDSCRSDTGISSHVAAFASKRTHWNVIGCRRLDRHCRRVVQRCIGSAVALDAVSCSRLNIGMNIRQRWHSRVTRRSVTSSASDVGRRYVIARFDLSKPFVKAAMAA